LAVDLVAQNFVLQRSIKYVIGYFVAHPRTLGGQIAHIFQYGGKREAGLLGKLFLALQLAQQRCLNGIPGVAPQFLTPF